MGSLGAETESIIKEALENKVKKYKESQKSTGKYLKKMNEFQIGSIKANKRILQSLGGDTISNKKIEEIYNTLKKDSNDNNEEIDLAFYDEKTGKDNIIGLKEAIKKIIKKSTDKRVTKILKDLLAEITPIIDTTGKSLKLYGLNTRYNELRDKYNHSKNKTEKNDEEYDEEYDGSTSSITQAEENTEVPQKKLSTVQNNLMVRLFPKQAAEMGLKLKKDKYSDNDEIEAEELKEDEEEKVVAATEEKTATTEEKISESQNDDLEKIKELMFDYMSKNMDKKNEDFVFNLVAQFFPDEFAEFEKNYEENKEETEIPEIENEQYEYELLRMDYISKLERKIMYAARIINSLRIQDEKKQKMEKLEKTEKEMAQKRKEEEKKAKKEKKKKKANKDTTGNISNADIIDNDPGDNENQKLITKNSNEDQDTATDNNAPAPAANEQENKTTEGKENLVTEPTTNTPNESTNKKTSDLNSDICKFLIKLSRQNENSINTTSIKDIYMEHKIRTMLNEGGITEEATQSEIIFKDDKKNKSIWDDDTSNKST